MKAQTKKWKYSDLKMAGIKITDIDGNDICFIDNMNDYNEANAKLIVIAPELLKCANDFMLAYDSLGKELQAKLYKEYGIEPFGLNTAIKQATE